jgi:hypothetical protein
VPVALGTPQRPLETADVYAKLVRIAGEERAGRLLASLDAGNAGALRAALIA